MSAAVRIAGFLVFACAAAVAAYTVGHIAHDDLGFARQAIRTGAAVRRGARRATCHYDVWQQVREVEVSRAIGSGLELTKGITFQTSALPPLG
jgi:hypothetical protein